MIRIGLLALAGVLYGQPSYQYFLAGNAADVKAKTAAGVLLAGGGQDVDSAVAWFLNRAGGGDVVVLRASGTDAYNPYFQKLVKVDSVETIIFMSEAAARDSFVLEKIRNAEAIFFAGGDQWNYVRYWSNTPVAEALNDAIRRGVPIGGTSAGLAILGEYSFSAEHDTVTSAEALANPFHEKVTIHRGLLRIPRLDCLITDSHFAKRDRIGRLLVFLERIRSQNGCGEVRGIGVDERAAVTLDEKGQAQVMGEGSAFLLRFRQPPVFEVEAVAAGRAFDWGRWGRAGGQKYQLRVEEGVVKSSIPGTYGLQ
jgi:cyanophycinase